MSHSRAHDRVSSFPLPSPPASPPTTTFNGPSTPPTTVDEPHPRPLSGSNSNCKSLPSPVPPSLEPQLSERDSIFATHYSDHATTRAYHHQPQASYFPLPPTQSHSYPEHYPPMATSLAKMPAHTFASQEMSGTLPPHDIFIYSGSPTNRPATPQELAVRSSNTQLARISSRGLPEHLIALPPFSTPTASPTSRAATPTQPSAALPVASRADHEERQAYRSWRQGKAVYGGRVMGEGEAVDGKVAEIEKKIEATLPRTENVANPRSRKASQYMRIFTQGNEPVDRPTRSLKSHLAAKTPVGVGDPGEFPVLF